MNCQNKFHREYTMINQSNFIIHVYFWNKIIHRLLFSNFLNSVDFLRTFITELLKQQYSGSFWARVIFKAVYRMNTFSAVLPFSIKPV